jgi:hypothetical protein
LFQGVRLTSDLPECTVTERSALISVS